ncbi:MAG: adenylosuccinate lyase, partial [Bacteroidales bacterium]|nr:adenylosuccinate lyase [Bacteroidales bacterium]
ALKELTRTHEKIEKSTIIDFIESLKVPEAVKQEMRDITPHNYTGM